MDSTIPDSTSSDGTAREDEDKGISEGTCVVSSWWREIIRRGTIFWCDHEYREYIVLGSGARTDGPVLCDNWRARLVLGDMAPDGAFS